MSDISHLRKILKYNPVTGIFTWKVNRKGTKGIGSVAGSINTHHKTGKRYVLIHTCGKHWRAHRLAWLFMYNSECDSEIDHENGDGTDNRWDNLKKTDSKGNARNQRKRSGNAYSNVMGVRWHRKAKKWVVGIHHKGKNKHLGLFTNFEQAVRVRKQAEVECGYHKNHGTIRPL